MYTIKAISDLKANDGGDEYTFESPIIPQAGDIISDGVDGGYKATVLHRLIPSVNFIEGEAIKVMVKRDFTFSERRALREHDNCEFNVPYGCYPNDLYSFTVYGNPYKKYQLEDASKSALINLCMKLKERELDLYKKYHNLRDKLGDLVMSSHLGEPIEMDKAIDNLLRENGNPKSDS